MPYVRYFVIALYSTVMVLRNQVVRSPQNALNCGNGEKSVLFRLISFSFEGAYELCVLNLY